MIQAIEFLTSAIKGGRKPVGTLDGLRMLGLEDLPRWKKALEQGQASGYGCYFPYVLVHHRKGRSAVLITEDGGCLCSYILRQKERGRHLDLYLPPIPMDVNVTRRCLERANDFNGDRSARILRIDARDAPVVAGIPGLQVRKRRSQYLYAPRDFGDLQGNKYRAVRYHVSRVQRLEGLRVLPYDIRFAVPCQELLEKWAEHHRARHGTSGDAGMSKRALALTGLIQSPDLLGQVILIGERVVGFAFGGELRPGLGCLFEAKTDHDIPGLSQFLYYSFLSKWMDGFDLVNGGSDARRKGLRQLKDSLRPAAMHVEYRGRQEVS